MIYVKGWQHNIDTMVGVTFSYWEYSMNKSFCIYLIGGLLYSASAFSDHYAILYCEPNSNGSVEVTAADADSSSGVASSSKIGRSCSQTIHEISQKGYVLLGSAITGAKGGLTIFVLEKKNHD